MVYCLVVALIIALDQITKIIVRSNIAYGQEIPVIGDWFRFTFVKNEGTAFSMFSGNQWITIVFTMVLIIACFVFLMKEAKSGSKKFALCLTCIFGGGVSNMFDRLYFGYVTDMISVGRFAVFNVADMFVTCACILAIIYILFYYKEDR